MMKVLRWGFKPYVLFFCLCCGFLSAQETEEESEKPNWYYDVLGSAKIGFLLPVPHGSNFLSDGYDTWNGINLEGKAYINEKMALGLQLQYFKGRVIDQVLVGPIDASRISHSLIQFTYNPFEQESDLIFEVIAGIGWVDIRNERGLRRFTDSGFTIMAGAELSYRFNKWFGTYFMVQNNFSFLQIDVAEEIKGNFNNIQVFAPSIGLKFYIL